MSLSSYESIKTKAKDLFSDHKHFEHAQKGNPAYGYSPFQYFPGETPKVSTKQEAINDFTDQYAQRCLERTPTGTQAIWKVNGEKMEEVQEDGKCTLKVDQYSEPLPLELQHGVFKESTTEVSKKFASDYKKMLGNYQPQHNKLSQSFEKHTTEDTIDAKNTPHMRDEYYNNDISKEQSHPEFNAPPSTDRENTESQTPEIEQEQAETIDQSEPTTSEQSESISIDSTADTSDKGDKSADVEISI